jgi:nitrite reductase (NO-forming)
VAHPGAATVTNVTVTAGKPSDFKFTLSTSTVKRGIIVFKVTNKGSLPHDFKVCTVRNKPLVNSCPGTATRLISPGQSDTLRIAILLKGSYEYLCTVPGHAAAGMKGTFKVA